MYSISSPKPYRSVFREPCFVVGDVTAATDVTIFAGNDPVGTKRLYPATEAGINVGPYLRSRLVIEPVIMRALTPFIDPRRTVSCRLATAGCNSETVLLTGGTEDCAPLTVLSAAPACVALRRDEYDEIPFTTDGRPFRVEITFIHDGGEQKGEVYLSAIERRMMAMPVSAEMLADYFEALSGADAATLKEFRVEIVIPTGGEEVRIGRRYKMVPAGSATTSATGGGQRLAWINRYGAIDYHTFPTVGESRTQGSRTRIETGEGYRTVGTAANSSVTLHSAPCNTEEAEWLAEIFSSPTVWVIENDTCRKVEVSAGAVECSPLQPAIVSVTISPAVKTVSRKF